MQDIEQRYPQLPMTRDWFTSAMFVVGGGLSLLMSMFGGAGSTETMLWGFQGWMSALGSVLIWREWPFESCANLHVDA